MVDSLSELFPRLKAGSYVATSPPERRYNCIAWALENTTDWWWPGPVGTSFWPEGISRSETIASFQQLFASFGFAACASDDKDIECSRVALFANETGKPTHAARQLPSGRWTSKLGRSEDIEHDLYDLEGAVYGSVVLVMKRQSGQASTSPAPK